MAQDKEGQEQEIALIQISEKAARDVATLRQTLNDSDARPSAELRIALVELESQLERLEALTAVVGGHEDLRRQAEQIAKQVAAMQQEMTEAADLN